MKCICGSEKPLVDGNCPDCGKDYLYRTELNTPEEFEFKPLGSFGKPTPNYQEVIQIAKDLEVKLLKAIRTKNQLEAILESTTDDLRIAVEALAQYRSIPIKTPVSFLVSRVDYVAEEAFQRMGRVN